MSSASAYGFTNDKAELERVQKFVADAVADGWMIRPTYDTESVNRHATLDREGFKLMAKTRTDVGSWKYETQINGWGPDGLVIRIPDVYSWTAIQDAVRVCDNCGKHVAQTHRYGFAGRCCAECLPAMQKEYECEGWTR